MNRNHKISHSPVNNYKLSELWQKFKMGDKKAFASLYNQYIDVLFAYGMKISNDRELVKDSIQDLFIDFYKYKIELDNPESFEFYLFKAFKRIIKKNKKKKRKTEVIEEYNNVYILPSNQEENFIQNETDLLQSKQLQQIFDTLKPKNKEILFYKFYTNLTYEEIGRLTGLKADSIKKQVYRLILSIREKLHLKIPLN